MLIANSFYVITLWKSKKIRKK